MIALTSPGLHPAAHPAQRERTSHRWETNTHLLSLLPSIRLYLLSLAGSIDCLKHDCAVNEPKLVNTAPHCLSEEQLFVLGFVKERNSEVINCYLFIYLFSVWAECRFGFTLIKKRLTLQCLSYLSFLFLTLHVKPLSSWTLWSWVTLVNFSYVFWFADPEPSSVSCHGPLPVHRGVRLLLQQPLHAQILQVCMLLSVRNFQTASAAVNSWNPWSALVVYSEDSRVMELVWKCNQNSCHTCERLPLGDAFRDPGPLFVCQFLHVRPSVC